MVYQWKEASHVKADAQEAGKVFERLEKTVGLTAQSLLDESRPEDSVLHGEFEWDDSKAAERYRESQAAYLIRSICVAPERKEVEPVRAFFKVSTDSGYVSQSVILESAELTNSLLETAKKELSAFQSKYSSLAELAGVMAAIREVV